MIWTVNLNPSLDVTYVLDAPLRAGTIVQSLVEDARPGGKGNNVARVVVTLGGKATTVGIYGGSVGNEILSGLHNLGIEVMAESISQPNRRCVTLVDGMAVVTEIRPRGPEVSPDVLERLLTRLCKRVGPRDWVTLSGSLPRATPPDTYERWVLALRERVAGVVVDAGGAALRHAIRGGPTAIVPNETEYAGLGNVPPLSETHIVVTRGAKGVRWRPPGGSWHECPAPVVKAVNTTGAGDAFLGGMVFALSQGKPWREAVTWGLAAGSASVETVGVADVDASLVAQFVSRMLADASNSYKGES